MNKLVGVLNPQQWKMIGAMVFGATGPLAWILSNKFGMSDADTKMWLDLIALVMPAIAGVFITSSSTTAAQVQSVAAMPAPAVRQALENVSDSAKVRIANSVPGVATVVIRDDASSPKLQALAASPEYRDIVSESQNAIDKTGAVLGAKSQ